MQLFIYQIKINKKIIKPVETKIEKQKFQQLKSPFKYLISYKVGEKVRLLYVMLPKMRFW